MRTLVLLLVFSGFCSGQDALEEEARWNVATKLTNDPTQKDLPRPTSGSDTDTMKSGDVVQLGYWNFRVLNIIDDQNMLLILGSKTVIWVEGYPTKDLATDQPVRLVGDCKVVGTKQYTTAGGSSRTVKVVKMPTAEEIRKLREQAEAEAKERTIWTFRPTRKTKRSARFAICIVMFSNNRSKVCRH